MLTTVPCLCGIHTRSDYSAKSSDQNMSCSKDTLDTAVLYTRLRLWLFIWKSCLQASDAHRQEAASTSIHCSRS